MSESLPTRVLYELEPWHVEPGSERRSGFAIGPAEARGDSITELSEHFRALAGAWGHIPTYFVNRVTAQRILVAADPGAPPLVVPAIEEARSTSMPAPGDVDAAYVLRDVASDAVIGTTADYGIALAEARRRSAVLRPIALDYVVTERLGLLEPGSGEPIWSQTLLEESVAPAMIAASLAERIVALRRMPLIVPGPPPRSL